MTHDIHVYSLVDGGWSAWLNEDPCSVSCGGGIKNQVRFCNEPEPAGSGADCQGPSQQTATCNDWICPTTGSVALLVISLVGLNILIALVDGGWTDWMDSDECTVSCGGGAQNQTRFCANPAPENGGLDCIGPSEQIATCNEWACPTIGKFCKHLPLHNQKQ